MSESASFLWVDDVLDPAPAGPPAPRQQVEGLPAEPGLWVFVVGDMTIFGIFFSVFLWENRSERELFGASASELYQPIGVANTLVLLVSSYLVVLALHLHRSGQVEQVRRLLVGAMSCGLAFAGLKAVEYGMELGDGHTPGSNVFFTFYYVMTAVHLLHVLIGMTLLGVWRRRSVADRGWNEQRTFVESAAVYWHMVDLLWLVIFALLYLVCIP